MPEGIQNGQQMSTAKNVGLFPLLENLSEAREQWEITANAKEKFNLAAGQQTPKKMRLSNHLH